MRLEVLDFVRRRSALGQVAIEDRRVPIFPVALHEEAIRPHPSRAKCANQELARDTDRSGVVLARRPADGQENGTGTFVGHHSLSSSTHRLLLKSMHHELADGTLILHHGLEEDGLVAGDWGDGAGDGGDAV